MEKRAQVGRALSFRALPVAAADSILLVFPLVQAAAELFASYSCVVRVLSRSWHGIERGSRLRSG